MTTATIPDPTPIPGGGAPNLTKPPPPAPKTSTGRRSKTVKLILLLISVIFVFIPLYVLIITSLKSAGEISSANAWSLPKSISFDGWKTAWDNLSAPMGRSLILALSAAALSSILGSLNGFVFAKWKFPGANLVFTLFLFGMFIPYQAIMIPLQRLMLDLNDAGLPPGIPTLILAHTVYGIPICTLIFRNYYATAVPNEILEAAKVDGAGMMRTYWSIVLPVSIPGFVVALIWQFTSAWNDFLFALFLTNRNNGPVTFALNEIAGGQNPDFSSTMAGALLASLPTLAVYLILGKYFIGGLMSGSVK
ncbi:carbohydrate ABC transporter permease, partial [Nakamurella silvestris]